MNQMNQRDETALSLLAEKQSHGEEISILDLDYNEEKHNGEKKLAWYCFSCLSEMSLWGTEVAEQFCTRVTRDP